MTELVKFAEDDDHDDYDGEEERDSLQCNSGLLLEIPLGKLPCL